MPGNGEGASGNGGPISFAGGDTGLNFGGATSYGGASSNGGPVRNAPSVESKGCGCRVGGDNDPSSTKLAWVGALFALGFALNRRRSQRVPRV